MVIAGISWRGCFTALLDSSSKDNRLEVGLLSGLEDACGGLTGSAKLFARFSQIFSDRWTASSSGTAWVRITLLAFPSSSASTWSSVHEGADKLCLDDVFVLAEE